MIPYWSYRPLFLFLSSYDQKKILQLFGGQVSHHICINKDQIHSVYTPSLALHERDKQTQKSSKSEEKKAAPLIQTKARKPCKEKPQAPELRYSAFVEVTANTPFAAKLCKSGSNIPSNRVFDIGKVNSP